MQALPIQAQRELNPATRALEVLSRPSLRKKTVCADHANRDKRRKKCSYDLSAMFHAASSALEADCFDFPSIDWVSDDEDDCSSFAILGENAFLPLQRKLSLPEETGPTKLPSSSSKRRKSLHSSRERQDTTRSLVRCRAIATDLASLSTGHFAVPTEQQTCSIVKQSTPETKADDFFTNLLEQLHDDFEHPRTKLPRWKWED